MSSASQSQVLFAAKTAATAANNALRADMLTDTTDWSTLLTPVDQATEIYMRHLPADVQSLVNLKALRSLGPSACSRGSDYPFTFKTCSTNGLLTALRACLATHAAQLYIDGADAGQCMSVSPLGSKARSYLAIISAEQTIQFNASPEKILVAAREAAAHGEATGNTQVAEAAKKTYQLAFADSEFSDGFSISQSLKSEIRSACISGHTKSHVGQLVLKKIDCLTKLDGKNIANSKDKEDNLWAIADSAISNSGVCLNNLKFK